MLDTVIQKKIDDLPENIRNAVEQFDWATEILHIARDHHLQIDDVEIFHQETLLVIVGLTPAVDFKKNLVSHMNIKQDLAEKLVLDANEHIFGPLQKIAFTHHDELDSHRSLSSRMREPNDHVGENDDVEDEIVPHEEIFEVMSDYGVDLIDEDEEINIENKELVESSLPASRQVASLNTSSAQAPARNNNKTPQEQKPETKHSREEYQEPIEDRDLRGVSKHKIDTSILNQSNSETSSGNNAHSDLKTDLGQSLDKTIFKNPRISKNESFDVSPSPEEQTIEQGNFLKHLGGS